MFAGCFFLAASSFFPLSCSSMCMYEEVWMELVGRGGERKGLKTHYMMVKIPINKSNPNFNGFECAFFSSLLKHILAVSITHRTNEWRERRRK